MYVIFWILYGLLLIYGVSAIIVGRRYDYPPCTFAGLIIAGFPSVIVMIYILQLLF